MIDDRVGFKRVVNGVAGDFHDFHRGSSGSGTRAKSCVGVGLDYEILRFAERGVS